MQQHNSTAVNDRPASFLNHPMTQATATGALTLIPARKYPTWLRRGLIWTPMVVGFAGAIYLAANPKTHSKFAEPRKNTGRADQDYLPTTQVSTARQVRRAASVVAIGGGIGTVVSLSTAAGFWADGKIEQDLRRLKIPFPRAVMGIAAAALTCCQTKQNNRQNS